MKKSGILLLSLFITVILNAQNLRFYETFEQPSGADSVTTVSTSATNQWGITSHLASSGSRADSAKCSPDDTLTLTTDAFNTNGDSYVMLEFDHICKIEYFDKAIIEVSPDNGNTWTKLLSTHYLGNSNNFGSNGHLFNVQSYGSAWHSGQTMTPTNNWWKHEIFNISSIAADTSNVKLRFRLFDENSSTIFENYGWFLDNIKIESSTYELIDPDISMNSPVQDTVTSSSPQTISADITDNSGVAGAELVYYVNGNLQDTLSMTNTSGNTYQADIPFEGYGRDITYFIKAYDKSGSANYTETKKYNYYLHITPPSSLDNDAGIIEITNPTGGVVANSNFDIKAKVKNYGGNNLNKFDINWTIDGVAQTAYNWTGTLQPGNISNEINIGTQNVTTGKHSIKLWTSNPNDTADYNIANDTLSFNFFGCSSLLSGTYKIGGPNADYADFSSTVQHLKQCGINGAVTFNVAPGVYNEQISLPHINGISSTNTITFQSTSSDSTAVTLQYDASSGNDNYVVKLKNAKHITFDGITFKSMDNTYPRVFVINQGSRDITLSHNRFIGQTFSSGSNGLDSAVIMTENSIGDNFTFTHNRVVNGTQGLNVGGNLIQGINISHNEFINQWAVSASVFNADAPLFSHNYVKTNSTYQGFKGLRTENVSGQFEISYNEIYADATSIGYGIRNDNSQASQQNHAHVYNNMILANGSSGSGTLSGGILNHGSRFIDYYFNTVKMTGSDINTPAMLIFDDANTSQGIVMKNNIFTNFAGGYAFYSNTDTSVFHHDYNNYHANSNTFIYLDGNGISNLADWKTQTGEGSHSWSLNPVFSSGTNNLHINNNLLKGSGIPISGINDDIDGDSRDATHPDPGADEFPKSQYDIAVVDYTAPQTACNLGTSEDVTIEIKNIGTAPIDTLTASYEIPGTSPGVISENIYTTINPGDTLSYTFNQTADLDVTNLGQDKVFSFHSWVDNTNDVIPQNDSLNWSITSLYQPVSPITSDTTISSVGSVTLTANSGDSLYWYPSDTSSFILHKGEYFNTPKLFDTTTYWVSAKPSINDSPIMITEFSDNPNDIEIQNVSDQPFDATGWQVIINDGGGINQAVSATWDLGKFAANEVKVNGESYNFPVNLSFSYDDWIMIVDEYGNIMDFVVRDGYSLSEIQNMNINAGGFTGLDPVAVGEWSGPGIDNAQNYTMRLMYDNNTASDWTHSSSGSLGQKNPNMTASPDFKLNACESSRVPLTVNVNKVNNDAQLISLQTNSGCGLGTEPVTIKIFNAGLNTINGNLSASFKLDNNTFKPVENINQVIAPLDTLTYTFNTKVDLSNNTPGDTTYDLTAYVDLQSDNINNNDTTVFKSISSFFTPSTPMTSDTNIFYASSAKLSVASNAVPYWYENDTTSNYLTKGNSFTTPVLYDTTTYFVGAKNVGKVKDTIGTGTAVQQNVPADAWFDYSWSAMIIEAKEIKSALKIDTIAYYVNNNPSNAALNNQKVFITHTTNSNFASTAKPDPANMNQVFHGDLTINSSGWKNIPLQNTFSYNGKDNIIIYWENRIGSYINDYPEWRSENISGDKVIYNSQLTMMPTGKGSYESNRPNVKLDGRKIGCESSRSPLTVNVNMSKDNAGISSIVYPVNNISSGLKEPVEVELKNYGQKPLQSVDITWMLDGQIQDTITWNGNLSSLSKDTVTIDSMVFASGSHNLKSWTSMPNNTVDTVNHEDTSSVTFGACMSGTYTIGDTTGGANYSFTSFQDALNTLKLSTVCGDVTFKVASGTYNEQLEITPLPGVDSNNTVTFTSMSGDSTSVILKHNSYQNNYTLLFDTASYVTFSNMTIEATNSSNDRVIDLDDGAHHITLKNNIIKNTTPSSSSGTHAVVWCYGDSNEYNTFKNNYIKNGSYGIYVAGGYSNKAKENIIRDNVFEGFYKYGIYARYQDSSLIKGNDLYTNSSYSYSTYAMYIYSSNQTNIIGNKIVAYPSNQVYGIRYFQSGGTPANPAIVANNFISIHKGSDDNIGIEFFEPEHVIAAHNSINITAGNNNSKSVSIDMPSSLSGFEFVNNILRNSISYVLEFEDYGGVSKMNYNNYYSESSQFVNWDGNNLNNMQSYRNTSGYDSDSYNMKPNFVSKENLHLADKKLSNKGIPVPEVTTDIDGQKRSSVYTTLGADAFSTYDTDIGLADILNIPANVNEGDSITIDVVVFNAGKDTIFNYGVEYTAKKGTPVSQSITNDTLLPYGGKDTLTLKSFKSPAGQYQLCASSVLSADSNHYNDQICKGIYGSPVYDGKVTQVNSLISGCGLTTDTIRMTIKNIGADTINPPFPAKYQVDGGTLVEDTVQTQLIPGDSTVFTFSNLVDLSTTNIDSIYNIKTWIEVSSDNVQYNDTGYVSTLSKFAPSPTLKDLTIGYGTDVNLIPKKGKGSVINWYSDSLVSTSFYTGDTLTTPMLTSDTSYWFKEVNSDSSYSCSSSRQKVHINVAQVTDNAILENISSNSGCNMGMEPVTITVVNNGLDTIDGGLSASFKVDNNSYIPEEYINQVIPPNDTTTFTFNKLADLSSVQTGDTSYVLKGYVNLNGDTLHQNDTAVSNTIPVFYTPLPPATNDTFALYGSQTTITASSTDTLFWYENDTTSNILGKGEYFTTPVLYDTTTYWVKAKGRGLKFGDNIAPDASTSGVGLNDWHKINDQDTGTVGNQQCWISTNDPPDGTEYFDFTWPDKKKIKGIKIYRAQMNTRVLTGATLQKHTSKGWVDFYTWKQPQGKINVTLDLPSPEVTDEIRFTNLKMSGTGQTKNPNFREIEIFKAEVAGCSSQREPLTVNVAKPPKNAALSDILVNSGCNLAPNETVAIDITNTGKDTIDGNFTAAYRVNGGSYITPENINATIAPADTFTYTFNKTHNMTAPLNDTNFVVKAYVDLLNDTLPNNDTLVSDTIDSYYTPPAPASYDTTIQFGNNVALNVPSISQKINDTTYWYHTQSGGNKFFIGDTYTTPPIYDTTAYFASVKIVTGCPLKITEVSSNSDDIEIQNLSDKPFDASGWQVIISDGFGPINSAYSPVWHLSQFSPGEIKVNGDSYNWGSNIAWSPNGNLWAMIVDDKGNIRDFMARGYSQSKIKTMSVDAGGYVGLNPVNDNQWSGSGAYNGKDFSIRKFFDRDNNNDWVNQSSGSIGNPNSSMVSVPGFHLRGCESDRKSITVNVSGAPPVDAQLKEISSPSTGIFKSSQEPVSFLLKNNGTTPFDTTVVTYEFNNQAPVTDTVIQSVSPGDTLSYTFNSTVDMSKFKTYPVKGYISVSNDSVPLNDTLKQSVKNELDYCTSKAVSLTDKRFIKNVNLNSLDNKSTDQTADYTDFTNSVLSPVVYKNVNSNLKVTMGDDGNFKTSVVKVFIDVNRDGFLNDSTELFMTEILTNPTSMKVSSNINIPSSAKTGKTLMRIVLEETSDSTKVHACGTYTSGETEDYLINIQPLIPNDAGIVDIIKPNYFNINQFKQFKVLLKNYGSDTLKDPSIYYKHKQGSGSFTFNGKLAPQDTVYVNKPTNISLPHGNLNVCAYTNVPGDSNKFNDENCKPLYRSYTTMPPYTDNFEVNNYFMKDTSKLDKTQWELGSPKGNQITSPHSGNNAWMVDLDGNYANSTTDLLYTPRFAIGTKDIDSLVFWHYIDTQSGKDGGTVEYLNTSGNWSTLGDVNDPNGINWYDTTFLGNKGFSGNSQGWIRSAIKIDSSQLSNMASITQFRFVFQSNSSTNNGDGWAIDNIWVKIPKTNRDAGVTKIIHPQDSTTTGDSVNMTVELKNFGWDTLKNIPVSYKVNNNPEVNELWSGTLPPDSTKTYTFTNSYISPASQYQLKAYTKLNQDSNMYNDTTSKMINTKMADRDAGIVKIIPSGNVFGDSTTYGADIQVLVKIYNYGSSTLDSMDVKFNQGTSTSSTETWTGTLKSQDTAKYMFNQTFTSPAGNYSVCAHTLLSGDANNNNDMTCISLIGTGIESKELPGFILHQNIPNPAREKTFIEYEVPYRSKIYFEMVDLYGRRIKVKERNITAGEHRIHLNISDITSGVYYYSITFEGYRLTKKMIITK